MSSGHDGDDERFARVGDQRDATGRPARPDRAGAETDPELARDLELTAALRAAGRDAVGPDRATSARMRAAVMAEITGGAAAQAPRESARVLRSPDSGPAGGRGAGRADRTSGTRRTSTRPADGRPAGRASAPQRRSTSRILAKFVTGACAVLLLGAITVLLSRGSLPGEMLYGVKRASESAEIGLTSGQEAKGQRHLDFAATRLEEVSDLIARDTTTAAGTGPAAAGLDPGDAALVLENLRAFGEQARTGSRMILPLAAQPSGPKPAVLAEWAREQSSRLDTLSPSLDSDGRAAATDSQQMLQRLGQRATALGGPTRCESGTESDDLGPLPARECDTTRQPATASPDSSRAASTSSSTTTTTTTTTTSRTSTSTEESSRSSRDSKDDNGVVDDLLPGGEQRESPDPVRVPLPVPLLPQVDVPPLLPGLPGLSLG
ncbi:hypothetical protein EV188_11579 [Actinomycetospora succinea]|uniref:DUF5667 domain-containing protein n=1 Tax=Actinomycetospora succinea TaxID=663603 RepID=A0A4R6UNE6_9PSEU|nr:DUF5667 domain-containing protein [Actinomycetospora succinea]TDQ46705.1 hypothetical protein EV188_11579 [Actinomycetospora succinea]